MRQGAPAEGLRGAARKGGPMRRGRVLLQVLLLGAPLVLAGCLAPGDLGERVGGVPCAGAVQATWREPGFFRALAHEKVPETPLGGGILLDAPRLKDRYGGYALKEVEFQQRDGVHGLRLAARDDGLHAAFTVSERLPAEGRAALFDQLVARVADAPPEARKAWLDRLAPTTRGVANGVPILVLEGRLAVPLDATALWRTLATKTPLAESGGAGTGWWTLAWEEESPDAWRTFLTFRLPQRTLDLPLQGGAATVGVDVSDGVALTMDPRLVALPRGAGEAGDAARTESLQALLRGAFRERGLAEPTFRDWTLAPVAWDCDA